MSLEEKVLHLLHEKIGFNPESIGSDKALASVRATLKSKAIGDPELFFNGLRGGNTEFKEIIDAIVIPETWFFRDVTPFEFLQRHIQSERLPHSGEILRCLSVPCSTGEEPYSIAMALFDAGLTAAQFSIDAVDISGQALKKAAEGHYGQYSFRSSNLSFRDRYFEKTSRGYRLKQAVRSTVRLSQDNLLDPLFAAGRPHYDIVFCRNLLIYFDAAGWAQATKTLQQVLKDSGLLFMGHAELLNLNSTLFESIKVPHAFGYRKRRDKAPPPAASRSGKISQRSRSKMPAAKSQRLFPKGRAKPQEPAAEAESIESRLDSATHLADQGQFKRAAEICRQCLIERPDCVRAYFLLGLIAEGEGATTDAEQHYRRALYLDSRHQEAMVHLALMLDGRGDTVGAENLRKRARDAGKLKMKREHERA